MTVSQSQAAISQVKLPGTALPPEVPALPENDSATAMTVISAAPTSTMNMTGVCHMMRGSSLRRAPGNAAASWAAEKPLPEAERNRREDSCQTEDYVIQ